MRSTPRQYFAVTLTLAFSLTIALTLEGCALLRKSPSAASDGGSELVSNNSGQETLVLLGTNDWHGSLVPQSLKTREKIQGKNQNEIPSISYQSGGIAYFASYLKRLRDQFGNHLIWLDAGDEFQGSIESNSEFGAPMVSVFNLLGLKAAAIGNHEFDFGQDVLKSRMQEAKYPYLAANVYEKNTETLAPFPNTLPSLLIEADALKVGIIGLSTLQTPTTTRAENVANLTFGDLKTATLREAKKLRDQGAQVILITAHVGIGCERGHAALGSTVRKITDRQGDCSESDEMVELLKSLPEGTIDAVVAGHSHQIVHHWVAGIPVIEGGAYGRYFNLIFLTYDFKQKKLLTDRTRIEGPIPICPQVFEHQNDCNGESPAPHQGRGALITPTFHGAKITKDEAVDALLKPIEDRVGALKKQVLGQAVTSIEHIREGESPLGDVVADAVRAQSGADVALMNSGGIRAPFESGPITFEEVFRSLPFDNTISMLKISGQKLKLILRIAESGSRGFFPVSGIKLKLIDPSSDAPATDLDGDHKIEPWEVNRLKEVTFTNGAPIKDDKIYKLATIDYLVTGGDDLGWIMKQISPDQITLNSGGVVRDAVVDYLKKSGPLNSPDHPIIDAKDPRMKFIKTVAGKKRTRRRKKRSAPAG